jgi:phage terminase large subunit-like protein
VFKIDPSKLEGLDDETRARVRSHLEELQVLQELDPLQRFFPHSEPQLEFLRARTSVQAAFAGNRFGKTTALVCKSLIQAIPREELPRRLREFKIWEAPCYGRIVCPDRVATLEGVILPALRKWSPPHALKGGSFDKAWSKEFRTLHFECGSWIQFMTYEMDVDKFGGAAMHFIGYDEPPPGDIRRECKMRLVDYGGFEMFAMTPLKANTGWVRREIWKRREAPNITVVRGSIHDNPTLNQAAKAEALEVHPEHERKAREFGDFLSFGGQIYPEFERCVLKAPVSPSFVQGLDVVVGIDPGIRNAGIVWVGFDGDNSAWVFDELLLQDKTPKDYAAAIRQRNARWGLSDPFYVVDPAARQRGQTNAETVMNLLIQEGIYANAGQNDRDAGFAQMRTRMAHGRFHVSPECRGLRDEADDYAAEEPGEGKDDSHLVPVKGNDHRLDALRYAVMERVWDPVMEAQAPSRNLGWEPNVAPSADVLIGHKPHGPVGPMGSMS